MGEIMKKQILTLSFLALAVLVSACTQNTPSMMNVSPVELSNETNIQQIPVEDITPATIQGLANHYKRFSDGRALDLTMTFDPKAKDFTAMKAVNTVKDIQKRMKYNGVYNIQVQTMPVPEGRPALIASYNTVSAHAPSDCDPMPGLLDNKTDREIGDYKFGCGIETLIARQIHRPADLQGNAVLDSAEGRREAAVIDGYSAGVPREPLEGIEREDLSTE